MMKTKEQIIHEAAGPLTDDALDKAEVVEIRKNDDDTIDEIIAQGADVHMEQMSADGWYLGIDASDGSHWQFWLGSKNRKSAVEVRHTETYAKQTRENEQC